jgi:hypothetical protein
MATQKAVGARAVRRHQAGPPGIFGAVAAVTKSQR